MLRFIGRCTLKQPYRISTILIKSILGVVFMTPQLLRNQDLGLKFDMTLINSTFPQKKKQDLLIFICTTQRSLNPITYGGRGLGFLARAIRLWTITLKRLYLAPPNLVTFNFLSVRHIWQNFLQNRFARGSLLQWFLKWDISKNLSIWIFCLA